MKDIDNDEARPRENDEILFDIARRWQERLGRWDRGNVASHATALEKHRGCEAGGGGSGILRRADEAVWDRLSGCLFVIGRIPAYGQI